VAALVVEAPEGSGAVKFAYEALEQGKDVFALPGNVDADNCAGSNGLLKEGARPVTAAWDVLSDFAPLYYGKLRHIEEKELKKLRGLPAAKPEQYADFVQVRVPNPQKVIDKPKPVEYIDLEKQLEDLTPEQLKIVSAMGKEPIHIDDLIDAVGMPAPAVLAELTMLQIDGVVSQVPGKRFTLNIIRG
jgi:DNA processing protein